MSVENYLCLSIWQSIVFWHFNLRILLFHEGLGLNISLTIDLEGLKWAEEKQKSPVKL